jgi:cytochrome P450
VAEPTGVEECRAPTDSSCAFSMNDGPPGEAYLDPALGAWILSSHADVAAALRDRDLAVSGTGAAGDQAHVAVRNAAVRAFPPERIAVWRSGMERSARDLVRSLPGDRPVDLVLHFAEPWSLGLAAAATGVPAAAAEHLARLARVVFLAAAESRALLCH